MAPLPKSWSNVPKRLSSHEQKSPVSSHVEEPENDILCLLGALSLQNTCARSSSEVNLKQHSIHVILGPAIKCNGSLLKTRWTSQRSKSSKRQHLFQSFPIGLSNMAASYFWALCFCVALWRVRMKYVLNKRVASAANSLEWIFSEHGASIF